jgi:hypothetical protein
MKDVTCGKLCSTVEQQVNTGKKNEEKKEYNRKTEITLAKTLVQGFCLTEIGMGYL